MKKSIKKIINRLKPLVGHEIIRIKPTCYGDFSLTNRPIVLLGFTAKGELIVQDKQFYGTKFYERALSVGFTDWFWISYKRATKTGNSPLNKWCGKKIKRTTPVFLQFGKDESFMNNSYILLHASKHHVVLGDRTKERILDCRYAKPEDWALDE